MNDLDSRLILIKLGEIQIELKELKKPSGWLDIKQAVKYSACSRSTILRAIQSGNLKHTKQGGKIRMKTSWIDQFLLFGHCRRLNISEKLEMKNELAA